MAMDKESEIGALWLNTSAGGTEYLSGSMTRDVPKGQRILAFRNVHKQPGEKSPDYRLYLSEAKGAPVSPPGPRPVPAQVTRDDIPF